jgi:hypothetical protein
MMNAIARAFSSVRRRRSAPEAVARPCCIVTRLAIPERDLRLEGAILELGPEGVLFREAALYLFDRSGERALLSLEGAEIPGRIVSTDRRGFRVAFDEAIDESRARDLALRHGVDPVLVV